VTSHESPRVLYGVVTVLLVLATCVAVVRSHRVDALAGVVCADPVAALRRSVELTGLSNGAAGPGARPVIADRDVVGAELLIIRRYCPDRLQDVREYVDSLRTDDVR
jgi:hypothetical protein